MNLTKEKIYQDFKGLKEDVYQTYSKRLCPDTNYEIIGIKVPRLRRLAKKYIQYDVLEYMHALDFKYFEEVQLYGMMLNILKLSTEEYRYFLEKYISKIDSWAICDTFCAGMKICKKEPKLFWNIVKNYVSSENDFKIRFGIVTILDYYIAEEKMPEIIEIVEKVKSKAYYVEMAIAWLLSTCFIKYPEYMLGYLKNKPNISKFVYNKTLSKITDSYRVNDEYKTIIRKMHI